MAYCTSLWLEALAIVPQLTMLYHQKHVENITTHYILTLGGYRAFYLLSWLYRISMSISVNWVSVVAGILQTALYGNFVFYYMKSTKEGSNFIQLPV